MGKNITPRQENIILTAMEDVMHNSMMPYAEYVILERALPRVEDGLKPVQRRILYTMLELSLTPDKPHRKSARIVGDCLGKYHPHGDTSVYDAMVRMAQDFNMQAPLVNGHGNFGSVDGDSAAAMRYTEARLTPLAMELLRDIEKDTVPFRLNFDDTLKEPDMLPGRFPNLLVNGASGIAVGIATNIPPHNLGESIDAVIAQMDKSDISVASLMKKIKGPDFPTGGLLMDMSDLERAYETGRGKVVIRAKAHIEPQKNGKKLIIVTELPYQVNKASALEKILKLSEEKKLLFAGISDIRDESDRTGMRAVIEVRKDADADKILNYLYKYSDLQVNYGINIVAIADGKPQQLGLKQIIRYYIDYQKSVVTRRTQYDLDAALRREHVLQGLIIAVDNIDAVIKLIRASANPSAARVALMERFKLTEIQAQAVLDMRLQRLTNLSMIELRNEYAEIVKLIAQLREILASETALTNVIKRELIEIKKHYAVPRRTEIVDAPHEIIVDENDLKVIEDVVVYGTATGIKRVSAKAFAARLLEEGRILFALETQSDKRLQFFTNLGIMYTIDVADIPEPKAKDRGAAPAGLMQGWQDGEKIIAAFCFTEYGENASLLFYTKGGMAKRTLLSEYNTRTKRILAANLKDGDEVLYVEPDNGVEDIFYVTRRGMSIYFKADTIPSTGRATAGVKAIALETNDRVCFAKLLEPEGELLVITDRGYAKRSLIVDYELQGRNGKGLKTFDFKKNGSNGSEIVSVLAVREPFSFTVTQFHGDKTVFSTEDVLIEPRASKGSPLVMVLLDNIVTEVYRSEKNNTNFKGKWESAAETGA